MDKLPNKIKDFAKDLLFPKFCLGCQKEGVFLCQDCKETLDVSLYNFCLCSKNPRVLAPGQNKGKCGKCSGKKLAGLYFALPYKDPSASSGQKTSLTKKLIYQFKYAPYIKNLAKPLAGLLIEHFVLAKTNTEKIWKNSILVPVPLYYKKLKERGYNQSEELAKELANILKIPVVSDVLIKIKQTKPQAESKKEEREKNLLGAFGVRPGSDTGLTPFAGKKVFLVDDVYTTGSTMEECARVLKSAGARSVWGITIAREE